MFGLDSWLAGFSDGTTLAVVALVAIVLGLRHASDPDHLAAVTTLIAGTEERAARAAGRLGSAWGLGHATSLFVFGVPIVLFKAYLPERVQQAAETSVGVLIIGLAVWLLVRWRRGALAIFAFFTAVSMALLSTGFGRVLGSARLRASLQRLAPGMALVSLGFGVWYALGAVELAPYFF